MQQLLAILSALIGGGSYIPYARDILRGRAKPARAARIMFAVLMVFALLQQQSVGSSWALAVTIGETAGSLGILLLALKKGIGGLRRLDLICYSLLAVDLVVWLFSHNPTLALHLTILADLISMWPTLHKTWYNPKSETPLFFWAGVIAPILALLAQPQMTYAILIFPLYLSLINGVELVLIYRKPSTLAL